MAWFTSIEGWNGSIVQSLRHRVIRIRNHGLQLAAELLLRQVFCEVCKCHSNEKVSKMQNFTRFFLLLLLLLQSVGHVWSDALWDKLPGASISPTTSSKSAISAGRTIWGETKPHLEEATMQNHHQKKSSSGILQRLAQLMKKPNGEVWHSYLKNHTCSVFID